MPGHPAIWSQWRNGETHRMDSGGCYSRGELGTCRLRHQLVKRSVVELVKPVVVGGIDKHGFGGVGR